MSPAPDDEVRIPIFEEDAVVDVHDVVTGRVRVSTSVVEREERVRGRVASETVDVTRVPIGRVVESMPAMREDADGTLIVPVVKEMLVVEKRLMLVEELHVRRSRTVEDVDEPITLRSMRATVERDRSDGAETDGDAAPPSAAPDARGGD